MNKQSEKITLLSFREELEKQAFLKTFVRVMKNTDLIAGAKGIGKGLEYLAEHKGPMFAISKGALKNPVKVKTYDASVKGGERLLLKEVGDTAYAATSVIKGVDKSKSIVKNVSTLTKNYGRLLSDQIRGAKYKILSANKVVKTKSKFGKRQIKGQGVFKYFKSFNRKIEGKTNAGDYIVKKRKVLRPLALATTPIGFGAATFLLGSGKKDQSLSSRTGRAVGETALWSLVPPVAQVKLISDMLK